MKMRSPIRFGILCGALAATAAFGQSQLIYVWTNNAAGDLATAANWNPNGTPIPGTSSTYIGDEMRFDGQSSGPVLATSNTGSQTGSSVGGTTAGLYVHLTANQVSPVTFITTLANKFSSGLRFNSITNDSGAGSFIFGSGTTTNALDTLWGTSNPENQYLINNSANPAIINLDVRWRMGAGGAHIFYFGGTGNWYVTNDLLNANNAATVITKQDSGTLVWTAGHNTYSVGAGSIATPFTISGGTVILKSANLINNITITNNGTLLEYDATGQSQTYASPIRGSGALQVNSGTLTLSGANEYTGNTILSGGELIVSRAENLGVNGPLGNGGFISFNGGTLGFSVNNTYDYSPRFTNSAGQAFSIDTAGQNVIFTNALASAGGTLTKLGAGTLTLTGANTYDGLTTVSAGTLLIQGSQTAGNILVANSATLGVSAGGAQLNPATLTVGTTSGANLEFDNVSSTTTPLLAAGTISAGGPITIKIGSGTFSSIGQSFPLFSWTSGSAPAVTLGSVVGAGGTLSTNGNTIQFNVTSLAFIWTGLNSGNWDTTTANNWKLNGAATTFQNGGTALFDDSATGTTNVTLNAPISPAGTTVNASTHAYTLTSSGANNIGGTGGLTKNGNSTLVLSGGANTYSGATILNGGIINVGALANGGSASDLGAAANSAASLVLNGGTLQYSGAGATSDHLFTLGTAGGTLDAQGGTLTLNNAGAIALSGTGARTLTLTGTDTTGDTLAAVLGDNGGATALTKNGSGTWILTGNNTNSGTVTIAAGTLQVGAAGATGAVGSGNIVDNGTLAFNTSRTSTNGTITGTGSLTVDGGAKVILPGNNTYSGGTTINTGTLQVGTGGATGSLNSGQPIVDNGLLIFNTSGTFSYLGNGLISGSGNLIVTGGGVIKAIGANTYTGWTQIDPGSTFEPCNGLSGALASSVVTNNGTLLLMSQNNPPSFIYTGNIVGSGQVAMDIDNLNPGWVQLSGNNTYTGGTFIRGGSIVLGDGVTSGTGSLAGDVVFTNTAGPVTGLFAASKQLIFNRPDDFTFSNNIISAVSDGSSLANSGSIIQQGFGTVTLTGNNNYSGGTTINSGALQVGDGGTSGSLGTGTVNDNTTLTWNRSDAASIDGVISGSGQLIKAGAGTLTLTATNTYSGPTVISNGTLVVTGGSLAGSINLEGGTLVPAALTTGGSLTASFLTLDNGTLLVPLNSSLAVTNLIVPGSIIYNGGAVVVTNVGPALAVGNKFYLFSQAVTGIPAVTGAGATWQNDLATDGSITALTVPATVNTNRPVMQVSVSGSTLRLAWPTNLGWTLQTNSVGVTASNQWFTYPGSSTLTNVNIPVNPTQPNVFFRLLYH